MTIDPNGLSSLNIKVKFLFTHDAMVVMQTYFVLKLWNVYFSVRFGAENAIKTYLKLKMRVGWQGFLAFKYVFIAFFVPNLMLIWFCIPDSLKTAFKTGFSIRNNHVNLRVWAVNSQWLFIIRKTGCKWRYLCFLVYKLYY